MKNGKTFTKRYEIASLGCASLAMTKGEDKLGNNMPLPEKLAYLRR
jgi:hypothetical protein